MKIKRLLVIVLVALLIMSAMGTMSACSKKGECEICEEEAKLKKVDVPFFGKLSLCGDCAKEVKNSK